MLGYSDGSQGEEELESGQKLGKSSETWKHRGLVRCVVFLRVGNLEFTVVLAVEIMHLSTRFLVCCHRLRTSKPWMLSSGIRKGLRF